ncbi:MAG TPA: polysaccharide deacetylase family protein, partial [Chloroflexota bacterium]|nr:polysaccharide deacetylase family protein [Chloroflexota bacterium]
GGWSPRSCLVTFDDGFANFADHAVPVLKACGFTATVFVVAGWVGRRNEWPDQPTWVPRQSLMDWQALRAIAREGMEIGGHTFTHPHLARLGVTSAAGEIADGKRAIEDQVAQYVRAFAYPYGEVTSALERIARDHFSVAFGTRLGYTASGSPLSAARRVDVYYLRSPRCFRQIGTDPLDLYLHARQQLRDLRQLGARPFALTGPRTGHHVTS